MTYSCTGVILAGGQNKRFNGKKKAFIEIDGKTILEHIVCSFSNLFKEIIIVSNDIPDFLPWNVRIVSDIYPSKCSLAGIHTGLYFAKTPYIFVSACDVPFLKTNLIKQILNQIEPGKDIIIPSTKPGLEPLCAVYSKNCINRIEFNLNKQKYAIRAFFNKKKVKEIPEEVLRKIDPDLRSFFNINTLEDLIKAKAIISCK